MNSLKLSILRGLYFKGRQSIAELSLIIGKSIPNVTKAMNELIKDGFIIQDGQAPSTGGRRPSQFRLNNEHLPAIIAVAIDQYYTSITIYDLANNHLTPIQAIKNPLVKGDIAYENIVSLIQKKLSTHISAPIFAIGITMPGFVDTENGINNSYTSESKLFNIRKDIEIEFGIPTYLENDSTAIAIAEKYFGQGKKSKDFLVVNLNWGVGLGMIINNKLFKGHSGYAGEFSHIPISDTSKLCPCGKRGCLEVEASLLAAIEFATIKLQNKETSALTQIYQKQNYITGEQLIDAANRGDQLAIEAFAKIAYMIGKGIATLIHIINPEYVIVSGRGARAGKIILPQILSAVFGYSIEMLSKHTTVLISDLKDVQLIASASIAIENLNLKSFSPYKKHLTN